MKQGTVRFEDTIHRTNVWQQIADQSEELNNQLSSKSTERAVPKKLEFREKLDSQRFIMQFESKYLQLGKRVNKLIELYRSGTSMKSILPRLKKMIEKESNRKEDILESKHVNLRRKNN